jgi:hypothetical protein
MSFGDTICKRAFMEIHIKGAKCAEEQAQIAFFAQARRSEAHVGIS